MPQDHVTPEDISHGVVVPDAELPTIAAQWLADGLDSETLRELAGLTRREGAEARRLLLAVLIELGTPLLRIASPIDDAPWRGYWNEIRWWRSQIGRTHSAYVVANKVLDVLSDGPDLWEPGRGSELLLLVTLWEEQPEHRDNLDASIHLHLRSLSANHVPPLA